MEKHVLRWKSVRCPASRGPDVLVGLPDMFDLHYRGTLLSRILKMPRRRPIKFDVAVRMISAKLNESFDAGRIGDQPGQWGWYASNFVEWISAQGFHIVLTGEEFETWAMQNNPS